MIPRTYCKKLSRESAGNDTIFGKLQQFQPSFPTLFDPIPLGSLPFLHDTFGNKSFMSKTNCPETEFSRSGFFFFIRPFFIKLPAIPLIFVECSINAVKYRVARKGCQSIVVTLVCKLIK
jgi:hypothetical protein